MEAEVEVEVEVEAELEAEAEVEAEVEAVAESEVIYYTTIPLQLYYNECGGRGGG
jgi:hypothetical protein